MRILSSVPFALSLVLGVLGVISPVLSPCRAEEAVSFTRDIRPLLSDRCFKCHGPDQKKQKADLRLDTREGALAPLDDEGKVFTLVPGDLEKSELYYRIITEDEDDLMPPPDEPGLALSDREKDLIKRWIEEGADFEDLWSFVTPERPEPPTPPKASAWARNPVDHFVAARWESEGMSPSPEADRSTLIRRLSFDITGLPPTPDEVSAFLGDESPDAYEKVVDRLLASDRYGERMAVEWLDAARYADTSGYQYDWPRTMWRWRDWVIDAYNDNLSYDQFITWQIAGDLLPEATLAQKIATGFNRNHPFTIEGGTIDEEYRVSYVSDRVTTMGTVFLGLTLECARCHDHKYDPISQQDFYQLYAFFNNVDEKGRVGGKPSFAPPAIPAPTEEQAAELAALSTELTEKRRRLDGPNPALDREQAEWEKSLPETWTVAAPVAMSAVNGTTLTLDGEDAVLASGENPGQEVFSVELPLGAGQRVAGFRVEALTHESMVKGGPGRSSNGNAVLTTVKVFLEGKELPIASAAADHEQQGYPVAGAIDGDPKSGWAFDGNTNHAAHAGAFILEEAITGRADHRLKIELRFESSFGRHVFGRMRFSLTENPSATLDDAGGSLRAIASKPPGQRNAKEKARLRRAFRTATDPEYGVLQTAVAQLEKKKEAIEAAIPRTMIMDEAKPRETFILERGAYDQPTEPVTADVPAQLPAMPEGTPRNRLGLAQWMTARENPLTARVTMNRLWHQMFGVGIVKTVNDFGSQAELPTHPELLDWLAVEFMESGWDLKGMIKTIVMSATYRQSSATSESLIQKDPENRWLARGPRHRLSAEMLRDNALFVGGILVERIGGPSVKPYQPAGLWKELTLRPGFMQVYEPDTGEKGRRRSLYTFWKRAAHHPMMATFDAPNREVCTFSRGVTNTPLQALTLLHDPQFVEAARGLADRVIARAGSPEERLQRAFFRATARLPEPEEKGALLALYQSEKEAFAAAPEEASALLAVGDRLLPEEGDPAELAAWMMVSRAILNLSEVVTKN